MNSKYRIGYLCAGAAFFLFITLAYKMTYDYTMDKYMEKVSERNEDVQKADGIGKTESIAAEGEAVKGGAKKGFYLKELHGFVVVYLEDKKTIGLPASGGVDDAGRRLQRRGGEQRGRRGTDTGKGTFCGEQRHPGGQRGGPAVRPVCPPGRMIKS